MEHFKLYSQYAPAGDQPQAIDKLVEGINSGMKEQTLLGKRSKEADVLLQDAAASRLHARIWKTENGFFLEDLNSTNGTFKNGVKMQPYEKRKLETKDEIRVGKTIFLFR